jgi:hypothetical protein
MRVILRAAGLVLVATGLFLAYAGPREAPAAAQDPSGIFSLSARADGLGVELIGTGLPVVPAGKLVFLSPATAQATLDQFSGSAFASAPYPGDLIASLPTTINGLGSGTLPPAPGYPFIVATDSTTHDARQEVGPYVIASHTGEDDATADAQIGLSTFSPEVVSVTSNASVTRDPGTGVLVARASTHVAPIEVNSVLSIGDIRSTSTFRYDPRTPDKPPVKTTALSVGTLTIAGAEVGLTQDGLTVGGQQLLPVDVSALTQVLAGSGFALEVIPSVTTTTSVSSAAVQLTFHRTLPAPFLDTTVRLVLGQSSAALVAGSLPRSIPLDVPVAAGGGGIDGGVGPIAEPVAGVAPDLAPLVPTTPGGATSNPVTTRTSFEVPLADLSRFYPVLAGAALLALTSSRLVQWRSYRVRRSGG